MLFCRRPYNSKNKSEVSGIKKLLCLLLAWTLLLAGCAAPTGAQDAASLAARADAPFLLCDLTANSGGSGFALAAT